MSERTINIITALIFAAGMLALGWLFHGCDGVRDDRKRAEICAKYCYGQTYDVRFMAPDPNTPSWLCRCRDRREMLIMAFDQ